MAVRTNEEKDEGEKRNRETERQRDRETDREREYVKRASRSGNERGRE